MRYVIFVCQSTEMTKVLCVVESPADVMAIEQSGSFRGKYHVLGGHLSPLDGIGPEEIGIPYLVQRLTEGPIQEVILATNATVEGQATAHYLLEATKHLALHIYESPKVYHRVENLNMWIATP